MLKKLLKKVLQVKMQPASNTQKDVDTKGNQPLASNIDTNLNTLRQIFHQSGDIVFREFVLDLPTSLRAFILFADSLCDSNLINESILKSIMQESFALTLEKEIAKIPSPQFVIDRLLTNLQSRPA